MKSQESTIQVSNVYRHTQGYDEVMNWYAKELPETSIEYDELYVDTSFGKTHVLVMGPEDAPPLVLFHGLTINALAVRRFWIHLATRFRVYAPDVVGQPGKSALNRLSRKDSSYPQWACETMDALSLPKAYVMGISFGGWLTLKLAEYAPERIEKAVLVVPAGVAPMRLSAKFHFARNAVPYLFFPTEKRLMQIVRPLCSPGSEPESDFVDLMRIVFHRVKNKPAPFKVFKKEQLAGLKAPVLMLGGEHDIFYKIDELIAGAKEILPTDARCEMMEGEGHIFFGAHVERVCQRIQNFLEEESILH